MSTEETRARLRVLVVDDDPDVLDMLARALRHLGFDVAPAAGGEEALRRFRERPADVVLRDVRMRGVDGPETLRALRGLDPAVRCVLMSGIPAATPPRRCGGWGPPRWSRSPSATCPPWPESCARPPGSSLLARPPACPRLRRPPPAREPGEPRPGRWPPPPAGVARGRPPDQLAALDELLAPRGADLQQPLQVARLKRLDEAQVELVAGPQRAGPAGHGDHHGPPQPQQRPQPAGHLVAVQPGHEEVEQDDVRQGGGGQGQGGLAVVGREHLLAPGPQEEAEGLGRVVAVIDHEDAHGAPGWGRNTSQVPARHPGVKEKMREE